MTERRKWERNELLIALKIYCELAFGQFHSRQPRIAEIAALLQRTPGSLAMKLCNFASLDPAMQGKGLKGASKADAEIIGQFLKNPEKTIFESESVYKNMFSGGEHLGFKEPSAEPFVYDFENFEDTERISEVKTRTVQQFFRIAVISSYHNKCSICELDKKELLVASHIIPWSQKIESRADPANGISLCSLHDKAFDNGFIGIGKDLRILVSSQISKSDLRVFEDMFFRFEKQKINLPFRFMPNEEYLNWHKQNVYRT